MVPGMYERYQEVLEGGKGSERSKKKLDEPGRTSGGPPHVSLGANAFPEVVF
jgi:hypothetical protein